MSEIARATLGRPIEMDETGELDELLRNGGEPDLGDEFWAEASAVMPKSGTVVLTLESKTIDAFEAAPPDARRERMAGVLREHPAGRLGPSQR